MRFFKSFKLLHRRTKSEPQISLVSGLETLRQTASSSNNLPSVFLTVTPDVLHRPHPNIRILDLESENNRLRNISAATLDVLNSVKAQLTATQADLFAELHRSARQRQDNQNEIRKLRETLMQYERLFISIGSHQDFPANANANRILDQALHNIIEQEGNLTVTSSTYIESPTFGIRTRDDYMSALRLTLKSRLQLKQYKKIAKFWKKTAQEDERNGMLVTPSASTISSIPEVLSVDRQRAVDDLIARRRAVATPSLHELLETPGKAEPPFDTQEPSSEYVALLTPSHSLPHSRPCLSPLASQSLRQELSRFALTNRLANWPHASRKPFEQLDFNVRSYIAECPKPTRRNQNLVFGPTIPLASSIISTLS
ncbi:hypothetical protein H0H87_001379 [Tephrocybe sp. NHM501043]|nr:hypothetical protein H0H87_001379 [Tephrocybe sp. NHM501043]